jgi:uncharacterized protein YoxC
MDGSSQQKKKSLDAVIAAITGVEKSISELNAKFDRISEQLKSMQPEVSTTTKEAEKKPENVQQAHNKNKPQDVIYVRKSSEFSFYN